MVLIDSAEMHGSFSAAAALNGFMKTSSNTCKPSKYVPSVDSISFTTFVRLFQSILRVDGVSFDRGSASVITGADSEEEINFLLAVAGSAGLAGGGLCVIIEKKKQG
jgi:hypothetical protein